MLDTVRSFEQLIAIERATPRSIVRDEQTGKLAVVFHETTGEEKLPMDADALSGVLTLAENVARHSPDAGLDVFWSTLANDSNFAEFMAQLDTNPFLLYTLKSELEDIFEVPSQERIYTAHKNELLAVLLNDDGNEAATEDPTSEVDNQGSRHRPWTTIAALGMVSTFGIIAACSVIDSASDETMAPLIVTTTTTVPPTPQTVASTVEVVTIPPTELIQSTLPEATVAQTLPPPPETVPPVIATEPVPTTTLAPETTVAQDVVVLNDGLLTAEQCSAESGGGVRFYSGGQSMWDHFKQRFGITGGQVSYLINYTDMLDRYHIRHILGSDPDPNGTQYYECIPYKAVVDNYLASYSGA